MTTFCLCVSIIALATCICLLIARLNGIATERDNALAKNKTLTLEVESLNSQLISLQSLWVVGQYRFGDTGAVVWDLQGVFSTRDQAIIACKAPNWFIAPVGLDQAFPEKTEVMPNVEWPLLKESV